MSQCIFLEGVFGRMQLFIGPSFISNYSKPMLICKRYKNYESDHIFNCTICLYLLRLPLLSSLTSPHTSFLIFPSSFFSFFFFFFLRYPQPFCPHLHFHPSFFSFFPPNTYEGSSTLNLPDQGPDITMI